jgi:serine/threonine protein kinase
MEYVDGVDLMRLVKKDGPLQPELACDYIRQAALGLQHIHERGLVHRDIKPSNLMVGKPPAPTEAGGTNGEAIASAASGGVVKLLDLGLARLGESVSGGPGGPLTQAGGALRGTADYLSPEQAIEFHKADIRSDIYSLGCTFYFLLTGQAPFEGGSLAQKLMKHQREEPTPVEQKSVGLPRKVPSILRKMMAKKPDDRFQTPADAAKALTPGQRRSWLALWRS